MPPKEKLSREQKGKAVASDSSSDKDVDVILRDTMMDTASLDLTPLIVDDRK